MSQKLILPFMNAGINCGFKTAPYKAYWGYEHYGCDYGSYVSTGDNVIASGDGEVLTAGYDNSVGNVLAILYKDCLIHKTGKYQSLIARYMHLNALSVKVGDKVTAGQKIGVEGKTGSGNWGIHLHVEFDTDTEWPNYSPQVSGSNIFKKGTDTTINPSYIFHRRNDQRLTGNYQTGWAGLDDVNLPLWSGTETQSTELTDAKKKIASLEDNISKIKAFVNQF